VIEPDLMMGSWMEKDPLTDKERAALRLAKEGLSTEKIAAQLFLSAGTVRNYLSSASNKLQAKNRIEAARIAHQNGWL
jgi:two-component system response regulator DesR